MQIPPRQQLRHDRDFIGLDIDFGLVQHQPIPVAGQADQDFFVTMGQGPTQFFAVDGQAPQRLTIRPAIVSLGRFSASMAVPISASLRSKPSIPRVRNVT